MILKDFFNKPISVLFDTYFLQKKAKIRLIKSPVTTYAAALALATGTQPFEVTVTSDTDTSKNVKWLYDGVPGTLTTSSKKQNIANNTEVFAIEGTTTDPARGKMSLSFSNTVINGEVDPITSFGYNQNSNGTEIIPGEGGLSWRVEGHYNDGTSNRKMEAYLQFAYVGGYLRPIFAQFDKVTHKIVTLNLASDNVHFYTDLVNGVVGTELPTMTLSKNTLTLHPPDTTIDSKVTIQAPTGHTSIISQGYNGADDKWTQYFETATLFSMFLNSVRVISFNSTTAGNGPASIEVANAGDFATTWASYFGAANLTAGHGVSHLIGKGKSTNNAAVISFVFSSSGSTANNLSFGFYANDYLVRLFATGMLGIGQSTDVPSSILTASSTTKGSLPLPRMTKTQRDAISSPAIGLMIYQTDNTPGPRHYNGTNWMRYTETAD